VWFGVYLSRYRENVLLPFQGKDSFTVFDVSGMQAYRGSEVQLYSFLSFVLNKDFGS
jgi:hypothetical protein